MSQFQKHVLYLLLTVAGLVGLYLRVEYSGWAVFVGLMTLTFG